MVARNYIDHNDGSCQNFNVTNINTDFIEKYQLLHQKDPKSKVFAPLGEAYRKLGLLDEALAICQAGVKYHPDFPSGHVALAKILIDLKKRESALPHLIQATELSPENILAHTLLAESYLELRLPKEALKSYKMILFLNPHDTKAIEAVKKLESLTADEYEDELFSRLSLNNVNEQLNYLKTTPSQTSSNMRHLERVLSLADAYTIRNETEKARELLTRSKNELGDHPEIHHRLNLLSNKILHLSLQDDINIKEVKKKRLKLEKVLKLINQRRYAHHLIT